MESPAIDIRRLVKKFEDTPAVDSIDLSVPQGAFLVLLGPSGCGKTTTLRMLAGLEEPDDGEIYMHNELVVGSKDNPMVPAGKRDLGLVFQSYALWPHMTVSGNVEWPLKIKDWEKIQRKERIEEVLDLLGILHLQDRYPKDLSGGEQQRVAIARTIAPQPRILLFDEPLSNLDAKLRVEMRSELMRIHRLTEATSVYVTHDQVEAMTMASHVAVMRNGRIEQLGPPNEILSKPSTPFVARFIGTPPANLVPARVKNGQYYYKQIQLAKAETMNENSQSWLMYRAEHVTLDHQEGEGYLPVEFAEAAPMAGRIVITVKDDDQRYSVVADQLPDTRIGDRLYLRFPDQPTMVYPYHDNE